MATDRRDVAATGKVGGDGGATVGTVPLLDDDDDDWMDAAAVRIRSRRRTRDCKQHKRNK